MRSAGRARVSTGLPARRLVDQPRYLHVAIGGQRQGAGDRRRRHDQRVDGAGALGGELQPLVHAEPVLFIDDRQAQVPERDVFLDQRNGCPRSSAERRRQDLRAPPPAPCPCHGRSARRCEGRRPQPAARGSPDAAGPGSRSAPGMPPASRLPRRSAWPAEPPPSCRCRHSPCRSRSIRVSDAMSPAISATAWRCDPVREKGRAASTLECERAIALERPPRQPAHGGPAQGQGKLTWPATRHRPARARGLEKGDSTASSPGAWAASSAASQSGQSWRLLRRPHPAIPASPAPAPAPPPGPCPGSWGPGRRSSDRPAPRWRSRRIPPRCRCGLDGPSAARPGTARPGRSPPLCRRSAAPGSASPHWRGRTPDRCRRSNRSTGPGRARAPRRRPRYGRRHAPSGSPPGRPGASAIFGAKRRSTMPEGRCHNRSMTRGPASFSTSLADFGPMPGSWSTSAKSG